MKDNIVKSVIAIFALLLGICSAHAENATQGKIACPPSLLTPAIEARAARALAKLSYNIHKRYFHPQNLKELTTGFVNEMLDVDALVHGDRTWNVIATNNNAYQHDLAASLAQSCFPGIKKLYSKYHESVLSIEERQRSSEKLAKAKSNTPTNRLRDLYQLYLDVKACYEARKGYAIVMINTSQMQQARSSIKSQEENLLKSNSDLNTKSIWKEATQHFKGSVVDRGTTLIRWGSTDNFNLVKSLCVGSYEELVSGHNDLLKKDF